MQVKQQISAKVDRKVLGAMRPHFQPIHEHLSNRTPDEAKGHMDSLMPQGPVDFRTAQTIAGTM